MLRTFTHFALLLAITVQAAVQLPPPPNKNQLQHAYLVRFTDNAPEALINSHIDWIKELDAKNKEVSIRHVFSLAFQGYSAVLNKSTLEKIRVKTEVAAIDHVGSTIDQHDTTVREKGPLPYPGSPKGGLPGPGLPKGFGDGIIPKFPSRERPPDLVTRVREPTLPKGVQAVPKRGWNAYRISHRNYTKSYNEGPWARDRNLGKGVKVYVFDTGVNLKNPGFKGSQVTFGKNFVGSKNGIVASDADNHGHGTMCAGVIAGEKHGLSPEAQMIAVKIANDMNRSACDDVVAGIEWVLQQPGENNMKVISMSHYGFSGLPDVTTAVQKAIDKGLHIVVCAGNDGRDACGVAPSAAPGVISVGSVNAYNKLPVKGTQDAGGKELESTNTGKCVTVFAPGSRVPTLSNKNVDPNYRYFSWGTSIAAPQVAALVANRLSQVGKQSPTQIKSWLQSSAIKGEIEGDLHGAPNLILYNGLGA